MDVKIVPSAKNDLRRGFRFYEVSQTGAGAYFVKTLTSEAQALRTTAGIHSKRGKLFRAKSKKFPYSIYYQISDAVVYVRAILDARQEPLKINQREKKEDQALE